MVVVVNGVGQLLWPDMYLVPGILLVVLLRPVRIDERAGKRRQKGGVSHSTKEERFTPTHSSSSSDRELSENIKITEVARDSQEPIKGSLTSRMRTPRWTIFPRRLRTRRATSPTQPGAESIKALSEVLLPNSTFFTSSTRSVQVVTLAYIFFESVLRMELQARLLKHAHPKFVTRQQLRYRP